MLAMLALIAGSSPPPTLNYNVGDLVVEAPKQVIPEVDEPPVSLSKITGGLLSDAQGGDQETNSGHVLQGLTQGEQDMRHELKPRK